jgi:ankyrin repeat protein
MLAKREIQNEEGRTPYEVAVKNGHDACAGLLAKPKKTIKIPDLPVQHVVAPKKRIINPQANKLIACNRCHNPCSIS